MYRIQSIIAFFKMNVNSNGQRFPGKEIGILVPSNGYPFRAMNSFLDT